MNTTSIKFYIAIIFALTCSIQSFAQVGGDMDRARLRELERQQAQQQYNDWLNNDFGKGGFAGFGGMEDYAPFEKDCPIFIRGGVGLGFSDGAAMSYNASVGIQLGGFSGFIFNPEVGIDSRFIDDSYGDAVDGYAIDLKSFNLKVRPIQAGYSFAGGPLAISIYAGLYGSYDLFTDASYKPIGSSAYLNGGQDPQYRPLDLGASLGFDMVLYRVDLGIVFDFGLVPMYKDGGPNWTAAQFRIGFFL